MRRLACAALAAAAVLASGSIAGAQAPQGYPADYSRIVDAARKEGKVVVYATTDAVAANPLIKDFQTLYPGVQVEYSDLNSTELYNRFIAEANNEPDYEQMLADAEKAWKDAYAAAQATFDKAIANAIETVTVALVDHEHTYNIATAADQEVYDNAVAAAEVAYFATSIIAENQYYLDTAAADADYISADLAQAAGADEGDALAAHARGRGAGQQHFDAVGLPAGFLDQLAARGAFQGVGVVVVADQAGRHLNGAGIERHAVLLDEQHLVLGRDGDDDHRHAVAMAAFGVFPAAAAHHAQPLAVIQRFDRIVHRVPA